MAKLDKTFPTNDCAMCVMSPKLVDCGRHLNIEIITYSDIESISGEPGNYKVNIKKHARSVDEEKCTGCGECISNCPSRFRVQPSTELGRKISPDISEDEKSFIDELLKTEENPSEKLLTLLQAVNVQFKYLPENCLKYISDTTGISAARIQSVATFYSAFTTCPQGEHEILVCNGTACYSRGSGKIISRLCEMLQISVGQTTQDNKFTLKTVRCIGNCALAPSIRIDDETISRVSITELNNILGKF